MISVWQKGADVAVVDSGDRVVVLGLAGGASGTPRVLDGSGGDIWRLIDGERTVDSLIAELADSYDVSAESISAQVLAFITQLHSEGLVAPAPVASGGAQ